MIETLSVLPRKSSVIFVIFVKYTENVRKRSSGLRKTFEESSKSVQKSSENRQKRHHYYVYIVDRILHTRLWIQILSSRVQLVSRE